MGDHRFDREVDDLSAQGRADFVRFSRTILAELDTIDATKLSRENQVDARILRNQLRKDIWTMETYQEWAWDPQIYNNLAGNALYNLMAREYAPLPDRLRSAAARMRRIPSIFAQARANLDPARVPRIHAQTVAEQNKGILQLIDLFITPSTRAQAELERVSQQMYGIAQIVLRDRPGAPPLPATPTEAQRETAIGAALELAYVDKPARTGVVDAAKAALAEATAFTREKNLVTVPDDPVKIIVMPEFQRGVAVAYCDSPGPLDVGQATVYSIAPIPDGWTKEQALDLMARRTFQQQREAEGKWKRAQLSSTQLPTYFVGVQEQLEMRRAVEAKLGDRFDVKAYHDAVLAHGGPPVRYVRELLLDEPIQ